LVGVVVGGARNFIEFLFWAAVAVGLVAALIPASISSEGGRPVKGTDRRLDELMP
jgi:hypothetical protein